VQNSTVPGQANILRIFLTLCGGDVQRLLGLPDADSYRGRLKWAWCEARLSCLSPSPARPNPIQARKAIMQSVSALDAASAILLSLKNNCRDDGKDGLVLHGSAEYAEGLRDRFREHLRQIESAGRVNAVFFEDALSETTYVTGCDIRAVAPIVVALVYYLGYPALLKLIDVGEVRESEADTYRRVSAIHELDRAFEAAAIAAIFEANQLALDAGAVAQSFDLCQRLCRERPSRLLRDAAWREWPHCVDVGALTAREDEIRLVGNAQIVLLSEHLRRGLVNDVPPHRRASLTAAAEVSCDTENDTRKNSKKKKANRRWNDGCEECAKTYLAAKESGDSVSMRQIVNDYAANNEVDKDGKSISPSGMMQRMRAHPDRWKRLK